VIAQRRITDPETHKSWSIEERDLGDSRALFFIDDMCFVRIKQYPANWIDLPVDRLMRLRANPNGAAEPAKKQRRVLIVDVDAAARNAARQTLQPLTDDIFEAESAATGVDMARLLKPDLILLDYAMPDLSGAETVRLLKSDPALRHIPILLYTAAAENVDQEAKAKVEAILEKHEFNRDRAMELVLDVLG